MRGMRPYTQDIDDDVLTVGSVQTIRSGGNHGFFSKKAETFHQTRLRKHYKAISKAISDKRSYRMTDWRS